MTARELQLAKAAALRLPKAPPAPKQYKPRRKPGEMPTGVYQVGKNYVVKFSRGPQKQRCYVGTFATLDEAGEASAQFLASSPPSRVRIPWTPDEDATLRRLAGTMTARQIAQHVNRTRIAVLSRAQKLNLQLTTQ